MPGHILLCNARSRIPREPAVRTDEELDRVLEILWLATDAAEDGRTDYGEGLLRHMLRRAESQVRSGETRAVGMVYAYREGLASYRARYCTQ